LFTAINVSKPLVGSSLLARFEPNPVAFGTTSTLAMNSPPDLLLSIEYPLFVLIKILSSSQCS